MLISRDAWGYIFRHDVNAVIIETLHNNSLEIDVIWLNEVLIFMHLGTRQPLQLSLATYLLTRAPKPRLG